MGEIGCGLIGCGTVGSGVVRSWRAPGGAPHAARLLAVAVRRPQLRRSVDLSGLRVTGDALAVARDPRVRVVIEATGDTALGHAVACEALSRGKAFVTASKALVAEHGPELEELAAVQETAFGFEAAVAGAIPIVALLRQGLAPGALAALTGVLNGTSNFVLCRLEEGVPFEQALEAARRRGLAEADSHRDTAGLDTADKLLILARLCGIEVDRAALPVSGIEGLKPADAAFARERGLALRLLGALRVRDGATEAQVEAALVPSTSPLAAARDEENVVQLDLGPAGSLALQGKGAGSLPSAASVLSDVRAAISGRSARSCPVSAARLSPPAPTPYYVRLDARGQAALARRRLVKALTAAGVGVLELEERDGVRAVTSPAAGDAVRRAIAPLPWASVAVAVREETETQDETARSAGGRQA